MQDTPAETEISFIEVGAAEAARKIAMRVRHADKPADAQPTLVWLGGYRSDMTGTKAVEVERYAMERGLAACASIIPAMAPPAAPSPTARSRAGWKKASPSSIRRHRGAWC